MANEITIASGLTVSKDDMRAAPATASKTTNMADSTGFASGPAKYIVQHVQSVGTSEEAVALGPVRIANATGDEYILQLRNLDLTNYVDVYVLYDDDPSTLYWHIGRMRPGESWGPARLPKLDADDYGGICLKANTAACDVEVIACEAGDPAL